MKSVKERKSKHSKPMRKSVHRRRDKACLVSTQMYTSSTVYELTHQCNNQVWIDYDKEADVMYMSFRKPQRARNSLPPCKGALPF